MQIHLHLRNLAAHDAAAIWFGAYDRTVATPIQTKQPYSKKAEVLANFFLMFWLF